MPTITPSDLPSVALLRKFQNGHDFTDHYCTDIDGDIPLATFVTAFYTTPLFRLERFILTWLVRRPSRDEGARAFATGAAERFAAWQVEARTDHQLLAAAGRTRSWFMVEPVAMAGGVATRLHFGSAVVARHRAEGGKPALGVVFHALLGFHKLYSQALLRAARSRLIRARRNFSAHEVS
ncbi:MAG: hypothetical protein JNM76_15180 [Betaproteobacteria bacterium]|nr:hypothetical protein [Betaproteobacteria bacterium]